MRKIIITWVCILAFTSLFAQAPQGKITYQRTVKLVFSFAGMNGMEQEMPKTKTDNYTLVFGNHQSLWKQAESGFDDEGGNFTSSNGAQVRIMVAGNNNVLFTDLAQKKTVEKKEFLGKIFIVDDSITNLQWKITGDTKMILNMPCMKATAIKLSKKVNMDMDNGKMTRTEVDDTAHIEAWFTTAIPESVGPAQFQGQLPGAILAMNINDGEQTFKAVQYDKEANLKDIKEPKGKNHYTADDFKKERQKMIEEMNKNNQGGDRVIELH
ncbi:MAG: GLPGLI family protein [Chitinophagaceae bacterium]|nr:GLPGLI family protein [Chitinophagaceae bacterium]MCB0741260.1 GLPGLI family protein [Chitinophagaceae bacterium]